MRGEDSALAEVVVHVWGGAPLPEGVCSLLADRKRLLSYLDEIGFQRGDALCPCPVCSKWHTWALLKKLIYASRSFETVHTRLSDEVDKSLDAARALYGGRESFEMYRQEAAAYFKAGREELAHPAKPLRPFRNIHPGRSDKLRTFLLDDEKG